MNRLLPTPLLLALLACATPAQDGAFRARPGLDDLTPAQRSRVTPIVEVAREVGPAVVNVYQDVLQEVELPWPYSRIFPRKSRSTSLGSGVVIDPEGFILSNAHVINTNAPIQVRTLGGKDYEAQLINLDTANDVALLKIRAEGPLPAARLGTSSDVMVGESVVAIGNPLGNENTVTSGIVSSVFRDVRIPGRRQGPNYRDYIQLDAAINPGNSGGPLLNVNGEVIGINWAIASEAEGIGFAIPIDRVRQSLTGKLLDPLAVGEVVTGFELASDARGRNVQIARVDPGSAAARAGLRAGDLLLEVAGVPVTWEFDVNKALYGLRPGARVPLVLERSSRRVDTEFELSGEESSRSFIWRTLGLRVMDHPRFYGVMVDQVDPRGPAAALPINRGDLIDGLGRFEVNDTQDLYSVLKSQALGAPLTVQLFRDGTALRGVLRTR